MSELIQQTDEWRKVRRTKIGASDAPVIMGVSPWITPYHLWQEKLNMISEKESTAAMKHGIQREERARQEFINQTGLEMKPDVLFKGEFMMASLDGITPDRQHILEIKCPGIHTHAKTKSGDVPEHYYPQLQHQLEVCGLDMVHYFSFLNSEDTVLIKVYRDDKYIKKMVSLEKEFWDCMNELVAPKLLERDYVEKNDDLWIASEKELVEVSALIKQLEERERGLRDILISQCDGKNCKGEKIRLSKIVRKGAVDYSKIPEIQDKDLEKYRKPPIESWRISYG
jgi:putative phage-type endonuclease